MWTNFIRRLNLAIMRFRKRIMPQSLFGRSMLILITPVILTLGIGLFVFFDRHWTTTTTRLTDSLAGEVALIEQAWEREPTATNKQRIINLAYSKLGLNVRFSTIEKLPKNRPLSVPGINQSLVHALHDKLDRDFSVAPYSDDDEWVLINIAVPDGLLKIFVPQKYLFSSTTYVFLLFTVGSGLLLSLIAVIFMRNQIRPVRKLALVAEQFGKGIDVPRYRPGGAREVRQAAQSFLDMRDRIKRQIRQRTDMLSGVSHDLRTPLTRMKLQLAMMPKSSDTEAMQGDIAAMEKMINGYLDFAKGEILEHSLRCNLIDLLQQSIQNCERQGHHIITAIDDDEIVLSLRPQSISRVFGNILENARLYAKTSWVTVNRLSRSVEVLFDDDGPGIPANAREDVFKPFHRIDKSRNQNIEGTGLGLTIARDMVQSHGGTISLDSAPQGGLRVIIWLPL
jgi:two-component system osmolarity sensor histidine kinase EnvZ